jgi:hypothetical protein
MAKHMDAFIPTWYEFKNSVAVEIGLLHTKHSRTQPFSLLHYCEIGDLPGVAS